ncbi:SDR family NAD(P)-dependent oxidoreductase [Pararhodobacter oceanensis]|uniref:NAD(P)-dependent oxidoreductase n=1 Tax=Pararhodobacter oceanensis TaxID=2172121 RepID=A0A2T8HW82_9RHOB|nr:SDR family NAD(P)-dependent oxidoreductase [Pararhodobacter oceanensis]PVH29689.1 NAD(P)-dependent oxidoreductase [Pararhodobacter oceanensis]
MTYTLLSIGHGFSGRATQAALGPDWQILGTSRTKGAAAVHFPDGLAEALAQATHLVSWVPPKAEGDPVLPLIADLPAPNLQWIGYASASSLYGDTGGAWIDESAPDAPSTDRGFRRAQAEADWIAYAAARSLPLARFRIAGIYGPGRSAFDALREGRAKRVIKEGQVFNRIHVEDLGRITAAAAARKLDGSLILADHEPAPLADVTAYAAQLLGVTAPPEVAFDDAGLSPVARSFYAENKRLRSFRLGPELGVTLQHPDYRRGLQAILAAQ